MLKREILFKLMNFNFILKLKDKATSNGGKIEPDFKDTCLFKFLLMQ